MEWPLIGFFGTADKQRRSLGICTMQRRGVSTILCSVTYIMDSGYATICVHELVPAFMVRLMDWLRNQAGAIDSTQT
jgi:hypothetical protein